MAGSTPPGRPTARPAATSIEIQALPLEQLEKLAVGAAFLEGVALVDFQGPGWLAPSAASNPDH